MLNEAMPLPTTNQTPIQTLEQTPAQASETISVVIPTRNRPRMAVAAAQSALNQTHPPHEVIVVIDGPETSSPDASESTAQSLKALADPRLRILALPQCLGGGEARNTGVRAATGAWIAFLDDDDLWYPVKLERQLAYARSACPDSFNQSRWSEQAQAGSLFRASTTDPTCEQTGPVQTVPLKFGEIQPAAAVGPAFQPATQPFMANGVRNTVLSCPVLARSPDWQEIWPRTPYRSGQPMSEYLFCRKGFRYGAALLQTSTLLASRELLLRIPFTPNLPKHQDWDWLLRAAADPLVSIHSVGDQPLAIFHVEGDRASVGRVPNWRFSVDWARDRQALFTPRAFAGFLSTECAAQAAQASWLERLAFLRAALRPGFAYPRALGQLAAFLLVPQSLRRSLRNALRCFRPKA